MHFIFKETITQHVCMTFSSTSRLCAWAWPYYGQARGRWLGRAVLPWNQLSTAMNEVTDTTGSSSKRKQVSRDDDLVRHGMSELSDRTVTPQTNNKQPAEWVVRRSSRACAMSQDGRFTHVIPALSPNTPLPATAHTGNFFQRGPMLAESGA